MFTIATNFAGLKRLAREYLNALPTATAEKAEAGWHCFVLAYLGVHLNGRIEEAEAAALYSAMARERRKRMEQPLPRPPGLFSKWLGRGSSR